MTLSVLKRLRSRWRPSGKPAVPEDFDAAFYAAHHPDLQHLAGAERLWAHYLEHGRREGRPRNPDEALRSWQERFGPLPADFKVGVYRLLNEDLGRIYRHDHQFIRHFLEHGRQEGRPYAIPLPVSSGQDGVPAGVAGGAWPALFRTAEFVALAQDWLPGASLSRAEALQAFVAQGIDRLAPISFRHGFDPAFYRQVYRMPQETSEAGLYRHWLAEGILAGRAPNEAAFLHPYLGEHGFPSGFDWQAYRARLPGKDAAAIVHRAEALAHLFDQGFEAPEDRPGNEGFDLLAALGDFRLRRGRPDLALRAYEAAEQRDPARLDGTFLYRRGTARSVRSEREALADFCLAVQQENHPWEAVDAAIGSLIREQAFDRAFALLGEMKPRWNWRADFLACVHRTLDACFDQARARALDLYAQGRRGEADAIMETALRSILAALSALEPLPPTLPRRETGPVVILANQDLPQCRHYRVDQKLRQFAQAGLDALAFAETEVEAFLSALVGARAVIFYRAPATPGILRAMLHARAFGLPTFYEIDDLLFDARHYPPAFETYEGQISAEEFRHLQLGVPLYRFAMAQCETAIASTPALAEHMRAVVGSGRAIVLRNGLDERNAAAMARAGKARPAGSPVTLFYGSGTKAHNLDFTRDLAPALLSVLEKHPDMRLVIAGHLRLGPHFVVHSSRITQLGFIADLDAYWGVLQACDLNLAVLTPGEAADCKSEIKWLEAAACGVPSVVSATATHRQVLEHGVDAFLVEHPGEWLACLEALIADPHLRQSMARRAQEKARRLYDPGKGAEILAAAFAPPRPEPVEPPRPRRLKVLICNVFFAPQSHGGAARVVQDNVDHLIDHCPDIEVSLFATDDGRNPFDALRCDSYRGRPVFRVSPAPDRLRDWRPFNPRHAGPFRTVLDRIRPDIVHFHCVQRLTATLVQVAAEAGIPYLVTLHDGWWISDSQFFIDRDGRLCLPGPDLLHICAVEGVGLPQSIARRRALEDLLGRAAAVLSVSRPFAELHQRAGIGNIRVLENGVPALRPLPRRRREDGRLALGHLSDRSIHKGALLVEAALRKGRFERLALTMIDNTLGPEERIHTLWGTTPVLLRGPCPQADMAALYAELDVLLAPSIWPESFGLVAREALSLGLLVVASDRGAIGDGIEQSRRGAVIDVSTGAALETILRAMDANPQGWRARPVDAQLPMRRAEDQGRELAEFYRSIGLR